MKFKKVLAICKKRKRFTLYNCGDFQMLSDGAAAYELIGHPIYDEDSLMMVAEISNDTVAIEQKDKIPFDINDSCEDDEMCELVDITFGYRGNVLQPVRSKSGTEFIDKKYLAPFSGEEYTICKRKSLYVIKVGMLAKGFICPIIIQDTAFKKELNQIIQSITDEVPKESASDDNGEQLILN